MTISLSPVNHTQREFAEIWRGKSRRPTPAQLLAVKELLRSDGRRLNNRGTGGIQFFLQLLPEANPWHVCFAFGLVWGYFAQWEPAFIEAAAAFLKDGDNAALKRAASMRGTLSSEALESFLQAGFTLFYRTNLAPKLPESIRAFQLVQDKWLKAHSQPNKVRSGGIWSSTAMFLVALLSKPELARTQTKTPPLLPPSEPVIEGLHILHETQFIRRPPAEPYEAKKGFDEATLVFNNTFFNELADGCADCSVADINSGLYLLGTRDEGSDEWLK